VWLLPQRKLNEVFPLDRNAHSSLRLEKRFEPTVRRSVNCPSERGASGLFPFVYWRQTLSSLSLSTNSLHLPTSTSSPPMPAPSAPPSSDEEGDHEYVEMQDSEPEQPNTRVPTTSLASRFKSLCKASPPPSPPPPPPPSKPTTTVSTAAPPPPRRQINLNNPRSTGVRSCDQCRISKQRCDRSRPCASCESSTIESLSSSFTESSLRC